MVESANFPDMHCCVCGKARYYRHAVDLMTAVKESDVRSAGEAQGRRLSGGSIPKPSAVPTDPRSALDYLSKIHVAALEDNGVPMEITLTPVKWLVSERLSGLKVLPWLLQGPVA